MIEFKIPEHVVAWAKKRAEKYNFEKHRMVDKKDPAGFIGEWAFHQCRPEAIHADTYDFDFISNDLRIDVKTMKQSVRPTADNPHNVTDKDFKQDCDLYVFCICLNDFSKVWVAGWLWRDEFFNEVATRFEAGETYPEGNRFRNKFFFHDNTWTVSRSQIRGIHA